MQFGQVGVGDNIDQCSPVQVRFSDDQACCLSYNDPYENLTRQLLTLFASYIIILISSLSLKFLLSFLTHTNLCWTFIESSSSLMWMETYLSCD